MSWSVPLLRPVVVADQTPPLLTIGDAITYLHQHFVAKRDPELLNELMISLALASMGNRSVTVSEATEQLEAFLAVRQIRLAA